MLVGIHSVDVVSEPPAQLVYLILFTGGADVGLVTDHFIGYLHRHSRFSCALVK